jgi:transposase
VWLGRVSFDQAADQVVFEDYRAVAAAAAERVRRLEAALMRVASEAPQAELITALGAIRGIGFISAVTIAAEAGDLRRFATARQFMAYVGLVPSEWSSGPVRHRGRITKTGNRLIRHVLGQAAHNARYRPNVSASLWARQRLVSPEIVALDRKAQMRLHHRYRSLVGRIGLNKTVIAVARELAGFVWAAGQHVAPRTA